MSGKWKNLKPNSNYKKFLSHILNINETKMEVTNHARNGKHYTRIIHLLNLKRSAVFRWGGNNQNYRKFKERKIKETNKLNKLKAECCA